MSKLDWDEMLLSIDWETENWRTHLTTLNAVPWEELHSSTVIKLDEMHRAYDRAHPEGGANIGPAAIEKLRRQATIESPSARDWITDKGPSSPVPEPVVAKRSLGPNIDPKNKWVYKNEMPGFMTAGFELELPIAVFTKGDLTADNPHPEETRWLAGDMVNANMPRDKIKQVVVDQVISVLNSQLEGMVFIPKDEDEGTELHNLRMDNLHRADQELPEIPPEGVGSSPSSTGLPLSAVAENAAQGALQTALRTVFSVEAGGKSLAVATESDIASAVNLAAITGVVLTVDRTKAKSRLTDLLRLEAYRAKRDPHHVPLRYMKPRYRAFSVYAVTERIPRLIKREDYDDTPSEATFSMNPYHYEMIKIASPVMRIEYPPTDIEKIVSQICKTMRNNFRIHKVMPSIGTTAQITISHSTGFTLLDIKRLVTLVSITQGSLARLNQEHRSSARYETVCGPIKRVSRLAGLASGDPSSPNFDPDNIMPNLDRDTQRHCLAEMEQHVPVDLLEKQINLNDKVFYSKLWEYTTVNQIAKAVTTGVRFRKTDVEVKCTGAGDTTEGVEIEGEEALRAEEAGEDPNINVVDAERGVFEFRKCASTMDSDHIMCWMVICFSLVNAAKNMNAHDFKDLLTQILNDKPLLGVLEISEDVQNVFKNAMGEKDFFEPPDSKVLWSNPFYDRLT
ncbi:hypothetical protein F4776DRAFT_73404 [Hypoxylon sp. NC0597]|nr:hypothetical protein F4776DRAFT_73404 [Hypoxylon sp. NC0597]